MKSPTDVDGFWGYFWSLFTSPDTAPALTVGFLGGIVIGYLVLDRFYYKKLFEMERALCDERISAMEVQLNQMRPLFERVQNFAEQKLFQADAQNI